MKLKFLSTVVLALSIPAAANAATMIKGQEDVSVIVNTEAFNLDSSAGQEMLYERLKTAAKQVCGTTNLREAGSLERALQNRSCYRDALSQAVEDVNNAGITGIHKDS